MTGNILETSYSEEQFLTVTLFVVSFYLKESLVKVIYYMTSIKYIFKLTHVK